MNSKRLPVAAAGLAFVLASASAAWACTQQGVISVTGPSGAAGSVQRVHGTGFAAQPVEIRWEEEAGEVLATAQGPSFDVDVKIPAMAKGFYYLVAFQPKGDAGHTGPGRAATTFQIDSSNASEKAAGAGRALASDLWSGFAQKTGQTGVSVDGAVGTKSQLSTATALTAVALMLVSMTAFSFIAVSQLRKRRAARVSDKS